MEDQDAKKGDIKGKESPRNRDEHFFFFLKQKKEKVNNVLSNVGLKIIYKKLTLGLAR